MRGRGLKLYARNTTIWSVLFAPHAGAWIETNIIQCNLLQIPFAPHAGAWIETILNVIVASPSSRGSPLMRGRGLKPSKVQKHKAVQ